MGKLGFERHWYFVLLAAGIGTVTAVVAWAFIWLIHVAAEQFEHAPSEHLWWIIPVLPMVGALIAGAIIYFVAAEARGHGVPEVLDAINRRKGLIKLRVSIGKWTSAIFTIGSGGSAGAEGPIVQIGSGIGSSLGRLIGANAQGTTTLLGCGAAAGIASVFNAPIAGIFFVLEILLRDFSLRTFTPIVIASVFSAVTTHALAEANEPIFHLGTDFGEFLPGEIPNYVLLGIACGLVAIAFTKSLYWTEDLYERIRLHPIIKPVTGAALLGGLGLCYFWYFKPEGADQAIPPFFSNGYPVIERLLAADFYQDGGATQIVTVLLAICLFKGVATCLTLGSGGSGGIFAPSLMLGAAAGGALGAVFSTLGWAPQASAAHYALVGMAAVVAATTHAPLTAILIVYEMSRSYQVILPLMLAAVISTVVARLIMMDSIYTLKLRRRGVRLGAMSDLTILRRLTVNDVPLVAPVFVHPEESAERLLELSERTTVNDFVVTDRGDHYLGLVIDSDLKEALVYREAIPLLQVSELQRDDLPTVTPDETLDRVLFKFSKYDVHSLAVLDEGGKKAVLGLITRSRLIQRYHAALSAG
ncbi:MAG: chloride channel protein [Planctomycetota bacterium]|nr:chloride channel protein [Planctomycetota bacterium]